MKIDFRSVSILVVGDPMVDRYHFGHVDRISPEAPVPVFVQDSEERRRGGAANVVHQLMALGCEARGCWDGNWTSKNRFMVGTHQLFRWDVDRCVTNVLPALDTFDAIVISDYAKGACTAEICRQAIGSGLPVIVDPKGKYWDKYRGCTVICPNHLEINGNEGFDIIEKRGSEGLKYRGKIYPSTAKRVFDVTGAGDTVTAVIAASIAQGIDIPTACKLANIAAGYVVGEVGTSVCPIAYLCKEAEYL